MRLQKRRAGPTNSKPTIARRLGEYAFAGVVLASLSVPVSVNAQSDAERITSLEGKLEQALQAVEALREELDTLKQSIDSSRTNDDVQAAEIDEIVERLDETEELASELDERVGSRAVVSAFDALEFDIGGFLDLAGTYVRGDDNALASFNRQVFELLFRAKLADHWEMFVAQAFVRKSGIDFSDRLNPDFGELDRVATDTVLAWGNYRHNDLFNLRAGRFVTPHGIINIEHFPALLYDPEQPQFLRPFVGQTIFPNFTDGLQLHGNRFLGETSTANLKYAVYTGNFAGNATDFNVGARVAYANAATGVTVGANIASGERIDGTDSRYHVFGADALFNKGPLLWKNELFYTDESRGDNRLAFYTQPIWRFNSKWAALYRFDYLDAGSDPLTLADAGVSTENAFGFTYKPNSNVHLRNIWTYKAFDSTSTAAATNAWIWQVSATLSF